MIEAWFSSSENTRSPGCKSAPKTPWLAVKPDCNTSALAVPLKAAKRFSNSS